jgi:hypothetical protein
MCGCCAVTARVPQMRRTRRGDLQRAARRCHTQPEVELALPVDKSLPRSRLERPQFLFVKGRAEVHR